VEKITIDKKVVRFGHRILTSINGRLLIQADSAGGFKSDKRFTLFWLSTTSGARMQRFIKDAMCDQDNRCRHIYLFEKDKEVTLPLPLRKNGSVLFPNPVEASFLAKHGNPSFIRYELFFKHKKNPRLILWACQDVKGNKNSAEDTGIYTYRDFYADERMMSLTVALIMDTLAVKQDRETIFEAVKQTLNF